VFLLSGVSRLIRLQCVSFLFVDLFSGIGGFHAALARQGGELVLASDIDRRARLVYSNHWLGGRSSLLKGDVRELTENRCKAIPEHDVLSGGFPCQPFSKSGRQLGVAEERGQLFYSILKVLQYRRPKIVLLENVRNLVGPRHKGDYDRIVTLMRELGYAVPHEPTILSPHSLPEEEGGAPQHRERVFIVGMYVGSRSPLLDAMPQISPKHPMECWDPSSWDLKRFLKKVAPTESERKRLHVSPEVNSALSAWDEFTENFVSRRGGQSLPGFPMWTEYWKPRAAEEISSETPDWKRTLILKNVSFYEENSTWIDRWMSRVDLPSYRPSLRKFEWQAGEPRSVDSCLVQIRPSGIRVKRPNYIPALVAIKQTPILGWERRELSVREAAVLQGFPPDMDFSAQLRGDSLTQLGNAVHVGVAEYVFKKALQQAEAFNLAWYSKLEQETRVQTSTH